MTSARAGATWRRLGSAAGVLAVGSSGLVRYTTVHKRRQPMTATARLDLRLDAHDKDKIAHAADLRGVPLATFVRQAALREAAAVAAETGAVTLSATEAQRLLAALDKPFKPNKRLQQALDQVRSTVHANKAATPDV